MDVSKRLEQKNFMRTKSNSIRKTEKEKQKNSQQSMTLVLANTCATIIAYFSKKDNNPRRK